MPVPKRWMAVSRNLNDDPEAWELTDKFGDRALRVWLEILAILNSVDNRWQLRGKWLANLSRKTRQRPATVQLIISHMLENGWLEVAEWFSDGAPAIYRAPNYSKYNRTRGSNRDLTENQKGASVDTHPTQPDTTRPDTTEKKPPKALPSMDDSHTKNQKGEEIFSKFNSEKLKNEAFQIPLSARVDNGFTKAGSTIVDVIQRVKQRSE